MFTVTHTWIDAHRSDRGGWTKDQCEAIGVAWPLLQGWRRAAIGRQISDEAKTRFELGLRAKQARADATLDFFTGSTPCR
jgi:hypothetical protein